MGANGVLKKTEQPVDRRLVGGHLAGIGHFRFKHRHPPVWIVADKGRVAVGKADQDVMGRLLADLNVGQRFCQIRQRPRIHLCNKAAEIFKYIVDGAHSNAGIDRHPPCRQRRKTFPADNLVGDFDHLRLHVGAAQPLVRPLDHRSSAPSLTPQ
jgi:hypothetical protein